MGKRSDADVAKEGVVPPHPIWGKGRDGVGSDGGNEVIRMGEGKGWGKEVMGMYPRRG